ncbi:hypothetical protein [Flavobacterium sp. J27]|uniref:hypothetical protein n=1 Tax=Flavobacterium sp. J27 TaxID=2060419 RepID=UPI001031D8B4|nr:hypothetical protein [Flavobacterium sp. J27]
MNLTKNQKILIGIWHFLPIVGFIFYIIYFFSFMIGNIGEFHKSALEGHPPTAFFQGFASIFLILIITGIASIGIKVFDIIHLTRNNKNDTNNKVLIWVLLFIFTGTISEIIYFFLEILPDKKEITSPNKRIVEP